MKTMGMAVIAAVLGSTSMVASANDEKERGVFYVMPGVGQSSYDVSQGQGDAIAVGVFEDLGFDVVDGESSLDDSGTAWSMAAGWKFSRYFAAEIGYLSLGTAKYRAAGLVSTPGGVVNAETGIELSSKGFTAAVVGALPLGKSFDLHARAGMFFAKTDLDLEIAVGDFSGSAADDGSSNDPFFGIGAAYHFTSHIAASFDYLLYKDVGNDETGETDVGALTLGVIFSF